MVDSFTFCTDMFLIHSPSQLVPQSTYSNDEPVEKLLNNLFL